MSIGLVGRKSGMTRVFTEQGNAIPVTVVEVQPNRITQVKTPETDGYSAIQVTAGSKKSARVNKSMAGHFSKAGSEAGVGLWEFRADDLEALQPGNELKVNRFVEGQKVDVTGTSKGKGFQGVVKRHNFHMQDATHGNSLSHRAPGSIGQCQTPGKVWKGKKMAGQMGNVKKTAQSLEIIKIDMDNNLLLIKGALPGATGSNVIIHPAAKHEDLSNKHSIDTDTPAETDSQEAVATPTGTDNKETKASKPDADNKETADSPTDKDSKEEAAAAPADTDGKEKEEAADTKEATDTKESAVEETNEETTNKEEKGK